MLLVACVGVLGLTCPQPTYATANSIPNPKWFWDLGNNGTPDADVPVSPAGAGWSSLALSRLQDAIGEWSSNTSFQPYYASSGYYHVYRDGTAPDGGFGPCDVMVTVTWYDFRGTYYDIHRTHTYAQSDADLPGTMARFWYGTSHSGLSTDVDSQGVLTHELGHWVLLNDLGPSYGTDCNYGTGMYTMCGELRDPGFDDDSWRQRSLTTNDIDSANAVY